MGQMIGRCRGGRYGALGSIMASRAFFRSLMSRPSGSYVHAYPRGPSSSAFRSTRKTKV